MSKLIRALKIGVPLLLAVYLMYKTFEDPAKRDELFEAIGRMDLIWLFLSILCAWVSHLVRAQRWRYLPPWRAISSIWCCPVWVR
jgi:glycosyltransferase 2 family protein